MFSVCFVLGMVCKLFWALFSRVQPGFLYLLMESKGNDVLITWFYQDGLGFYSLRPFPLQKWKSFEGRKKKGLKFLDGNVSSDDLYLCTLS